MWPTENNYPAHQVFLLLPEGDNAEAQLLAARNGRRACCRSCRVLHPTGEAQELVHPYAEHLVSSTRRHVQGLQCRGVALATPDSVVLNARALHARIQQNLEQLLEELSNFSQAGASRHRGGRGIDPQESKEVCQQLQAFRHPAGRRCRLHTLPEDPASQQQK